jgi:molybdate transport system ATP-binding protein
MSTSALALTGTTQRNGFKLSLDLKVNHGEIVAILGPNGAGKTTLLRLVAGLERLVSGSLQLFDCEVDNGIVADAPYLRKVGWVPHDGLMFDHLTVSGNVGFSPRATAERVTELLKALNLSDLAGQLASQCSGGQAQRVALARALAGNPDILLLDEPSTALDVDSRRLIRTVLTDREQPATLLVTHDPVEAATLADRIIILEGGQIAQEGTPSEIRTHPRTPFAASLSGLNLVKAHATGTTATTSTGTTIILSEPATGPVHVIVPPSAIALHPSRPDGSPRNVWQAKVVDLYPTFDRVRVALDGPLSLVAEVTTDAIDLLGLRPGVCIWAAVKATEVVVQPV